MKYKIGELVTFRVKDYWLTGGVIESKQLPNFGEQYMIDTEYGITPLADYGVWSFSYTKFTQHLDDLSDL